MKQIFKKNDEYFMHKALRLAKKGKGTTKINPLVGAVIVKNGKVISSGYHASFGGPHAEVVAIRRAGKNTRGATLYVTLEPCSTYGKTPPCTELIIKSKIRRVVVASYDPNPVNARKGISVLRRHNINVSVGLLKQEAEKLNESFVINIKKKRPFVLLKMAQSLDGKIATREGNSRWITGEAARLYVHKLRKEVDAVAVGKNTALKDNPSLTVRLAYSHNYHPVRIIFDSKGEISLRKKVFHDARRHEVIVVTGPIISRTRVGDYQSEGIKILKAPIRNRKIDIRFVLNQLLKYKIGTLLVEGGGSLAASFLEAKVVDKILFFYAPIVIGGRSAPTSIEGKGIAKLSHAVHLKDIQYRKIGNDFLIEGYPVYK